MRALFIQQDHVSPVGPVGEAFADRGYSSPTSLQPRGQDGSLFTDADAVADQALRIARGEPIVGRDGEFVVEADTICLHGDTPGAVDNARAVRRVLEQAGIRVAAMRPTR